MESAYNSFKVGDTINAVIAPANADLTGLTYKWEALDEATSVAGSAIGTSSSVTVLQNMLKKFIRVTVTDKDGKTFTATTTTAVTEDKSANLTLGDVDGLQSDGTGLVKDRLVLSYGSALGSPQTITWYYNDTVVKAYTNQMGDLTSGLILVTEGGTPYNNVQPLGNCKDGKYYAVIVNTEGTSFTSNTLELSYKQLQAEVSGATYSDDYKNASNITYAASNTTAVVTIKMKKMYPGTFYVYEDSIQSYTSNNAAAKIATAGLTIENVFEDMTEKNAIAASNINAATGVQNGGIYFVEANGETVIMAQTSAGLTRGKKYKVAFDQTGITETDDIGTVARKDIKTTEASDMAYLTAPAKVELVTVAKGQKATAKLVDAEGATVSFIGDATATKGTADTAAGFDSFVIFGNDSAEKSTTKCANGGALKAGVWTSTDDLAEKAYYYAEAKTKAGVYGKDSATLTSEFKAANVAIAAKIEITEDTTTPSTANITIKGIVAPAKVYVVAAGDKAKKGDFDPSNSGTYRGVADVKVGDGKASVSSVFEKEDIGDTFTAYLVPDDAAVYSTLTSEAFALKQVATTLEFDSEGTVGAVDSDSTTKAGTETITINGNGLVVKDQFGTKITSATNFEPIADATATVTAVNTTSKRTEQGKGKYSITAGAPTIVITRLNTDGIDIGDGFDVKFLDKTLNVRAKDFVGNMGTANNAKCWEVKMGTETLHPGEYAGSLKVADEVDLVNAIGAAAATKGAQTVELNAAITLTKSVTLDADDILKLKNNTANCLQNNGTLTLKGKMTTGATAGDLSGTGTYVLAGTSDNNQTNLTLMDTCLGSAAKVEIASNTTLTAATNIDATGATTIDAGVTFSNGGFASAIAGPLVVEGTMKVGRDSTAPGTPVVVSVAGDVEVKSTATVEFDTTDGLAIADGMKVTVAPTATLTSAVFKTSNTATETMLLSDGTNTITLTQANSTPAVPKTELNATTAAAGATVLTGTTVTVTAAGGKLSFEAAG